MMPPRSPPRSSERHAERRSYLEARTYIRPRVHAISRSCLHLHAAVIIRPGLHERRDALCIPVPSSGPPAAEKTGPGIDLSRPPYPFPVARPLVVSFSFLDLVRQPRINVYSIIPTKSHRDRSGSRGGGHLY